MNWNDYLNQFDEILAGNIISAPYDDPHFVEYVKLNKSRMNRWLKTGNLNDELKNHLAQIQEPQQWILISEPWCGDAAHSTPFIFLMSELNPNIKLQIQLRDSNSEIDNYLTNGGKAIPKLIVRDKEGKDLWVWGPRPRAAHLIYMQAKAQNEELEQQKVMLQKWYNDDKGYSIQVDFLDFFGSK